MDACHISRPIAASPPGYVVFCRSVVHSSPTLHYTVYLASTIKDLSNRTSFRPSGAPPNGRDGSACGRRRERLGDETGVPDRPV